MKLGDTTQKLSSQGILSWLESLQILEGAYCRNIAELPKALRQKPVTHEEIADFLFSKGISSNSINSLLHEIDELTRIARWYWKVSSPSEHETVAYLVVPLLRAIGWTPQKMGIEWNNVDIALFSSSNRSDESLVIVVEAKRKGKSCLTAQSQAASYANGKRNCHRLIVTDGLRYGIYVKTQEAFILQSYMNLVDLRIDYPIYSCAGVLEALRSMAPEWSLSES